VRIPTVYGIVLSSEITLCSIWIEMKAQLAKITSTILNPFLVGLALIVLLAFESTSSVAEAIKWSLISLVFSILPVLVVILYLLYNERIEGLSIKVRQQRGKIYLLASACAVVSCVVLLYLGAPSLLVACFVAGLSAVVIFMFINLWWKISVHTALVGGSVTVFIFLYGLAGAISVVLLPVVTWSRLELKHHTLAQVTVGAILAASIVGVVFRLFGLPGIIATA